MPQETDQSLRSLRLRSGIVLKPAVTLSDLTTDIEHDPDGADEFAALILALRGEDIGPIALR